MGRGLADRRWTSRRWCQPVKCSLPVQCPNLKAVAQPAPPNGYFPAASTRSAFLRSSRNGKTHTLSQQLVGVSNCWLASRIMCLGPPGLKPERFCVKMYASSWI